MARNPANDVIFYCSTTEWADFNFVGYGDFELVSVLENVGDFNFQGFGVLVDGKAFNGTGYFNSLEGYADNYIQYIKSNCIIS